MAGPTVYATPRPPADAADCHFYHSMDVPGHGFVAGEWDLRGVEHQYLGGIPLAGRRVLELGPASGHLTMFMEREGAEVVAYDLSEDYSWDTVPLAGLDHAANERNRRELLRRLNNGFWFTHAAHGSAARMVHGRAYDVPEGIGEVDAAVFSSVLLHLRDPFRALQAGCRLARQTAVVTEVYPAADLPGVGHLGPGPPAHSRQTHPLDELGEPKMVFLPDERAGGPVDTWWHLTPAVVLRFLGVLGFPRAEVTYHYSRYGERPTLLYTVAAHRG